MLPVFDDATRAMADRLATRGVAVTRFSVAPDGGARRARPDDVLAAIAAMHPGPGKGCVVFATFHGPPSAALAMFRRHAPDAADFLAPAALDVAPSAGSGGAPTVAIILGRFTGDFAAGPMQRSNRIILTAAPLSEPRSSTWCCVRQTKAGGMKHGAETSINPQAVTNQFYFDVQAPHHIRVGLIGGLVT